MRTKTELLKGYGVLITAPTLSGVALAQEGIPTKEALSDAYKGKSYSPYAGRKFPSRPL